MMRLRKGTDRLRRFYSCYSSMSLFTLLKTIGNRTPEVWNTQAVQQRQGNCVESILEQNGIVLLPFQTHLSIHYEIFHSQIPCNTLMVSSYEVSKTIKKMITITVYSQCFLIQISATWLLVV